MKRLSIIQRDLEVYVAERAKVDNADYKERLLHYTKMKSLLQEKNYAQLILHLDEGIAQFNTWFHANRYSNFLIEIRKHLVATDQKDANERLKRLLTAIKSNDISQIDRCLDDGALAILHAGVLDAAVCNGSLSAFGYLFQYLDEENQKVAIQYLLKHYQFHPIYNKNPVLFKEYTLLHFMAEYGLDQLLPYLLVPGNFIDIEILDNQKTPLMLACQNNHEKIAESLINHGAEVSVANNEPLKAAFIAKNMSLIKFLLKNGASNVGLAEEEKAFVALLYSENSLSFFSFKDKLPGKYKPQQSKKKEILSTKQKSSYSNHATDHLITTAIASQIFHEQPRMKNQFLCRLDNYIKDADELLKPLLTVIYICTTRNKIADGKKPLKTIISADKSVAGFAKIRQEEQAIGLAYGYYAGKNSIYIAGKNDVYSFAGMLHEWKHFADKELFGSMVKSFPFEEADQFAKVFDAVKNNLEQFPEDYDLLKDIKKSFTCVFYAYPKEVQQIELLARVPEVLGALGIKEGRIWLSSYVPELLDFYENKYNSYCKAYITQHELSLSPVTEEGQKNQSKI